MGPQVPLHVNPTSRDINVLAIGESNFFDDGGLKINVELHQLQRDVTTSRVEVFLNQLLQLVQCELVGRPTFVRKKAERSRVALTFEKGQD